VPAHLITGIAADGVDDDPNPIPRVDGLEREVSSVPIPSGFWSSELNLRGLVTAWVFWCSTAGDLGTTTFVSSTSGAAVEIERTFPQVGGRGRIPMKKV